MADTGYQSSILNAIAQVVGGTVTVEDSHFYSGAKVGDGTGIAGVKGCYSTPPNALQTTPVGVVYAGRFTADLQTQGEEYNEDEVKLILYVARYGNDRNQLAHLNPFRDLVPAAFRSHMQLFAAAGVIDAFVTHGDPAVHQVGNIDYLGWTFTIRVRRMLGVTYSA